MIESQPGNGRQDNGDGGPVAPWWQQKNPRISEIENEDEPKAPSYSAPANDPPVRRSWVPPQPPPVAMPEAAEAIRRPKSSAPKELSDDELLERSSDGIGELQRITKISEMGGSVEVGSGSSGMSSSEIQDA